MGAWTEAFAGLWRDLRGQRLRGVLSLLAVAWGTLAILSLLAFSFGFEALFLERQKGIGEGVAIAWPQRTTRPWQGFPAGRQLRVRRDDVLAAPTTPGLAGITTDRCPTGPRRPRARVPRALLAGVDPAYGDLRAMTAAPAGRWLHALDLAERRRVLFLGDALARDLFGGGPAVGRRVVLQGAPFTVVGVLQPKEQDSDYGGRDESRAFLPATTFEDLFGRGPVDDFVFRAAVPTQHEAVTEGVRAVLAARLRFDPADERALSIWNTAEEQRMLGFIFLGFHVVLGIAGVVTVLLGGVAVGHLLAFLVRRRRAEIGLKLAVGATPSAVGREVLLQALALCGGGAALGLAAAGLLVVTVRQTGAVAQIGVPHLPAPIAALAALLLAAVGVLAGWLPARTAARLDPVVALRGGTP